MDLDNLFSVEVEATTLEVVYCGRFSTVSALAWYLLDLCANVHVVVDSHLHLYAIFELLEVSAEEPLIVNFEPCKLGLGWISFVFKTEFHLFTNLNVFHVCEAKNAQFENVNCHQRVYHLFFCIVQLGVISEDHTLRLLEQELEAIDAYSEWLTILGHNVMEENLIDEFSILHVDVKAPLHCA